MTVILMSEEYFFPSFVIPVTIITPFPPEVPAVTVPFWSTLTFFKFLVLNDIFFYLFLFFILSMSFDF